MDSNNLWRYSVLLVQVRFLMPIAIVVLWHVTGLNLANVGIPFLCAIAAAMITGCGTARSMGRMPHLREVLCFAVAGTVIFMIVNAAAYLILAISNIGPVDMSLLMYWHRGGYMGSLMLYLAIFAFFANSVLFYLSTKMELRAIARRRSKESAK